MPKSEYLPSHEAANGSPGKLYLVGTPIGNLEDITLRALRMLKEVDLIACEDTRRTQQLLNHYAIRTRTISYHEHNELTRAPELIIQMEEGSRIALVSDAGMPVISDPGYRLVSLAIRHNIPVIPIPGASAFVAALAAAGLPVDNFRFLGFLPPKKLARRRALQEMKGSPKTLVFYEAPQRVVDALQDVEEILGDPPVAIAREVTKVHEEFLRGPASQVLLVLRRKPVKGEITALVSPQTAPGKKSSRGDTIRREMEQVMAERRIDERAALKVVARSRGISRSDAYRQWQMEKGSRP
ncbi:MAG: 16S rRNA (cytidine(1402)-2'-O)-methyltransferase [Acidobacteria bacterium]|nr:16S rRNA (cytidine(1402)-2'-O)-methyltransferase [Acidobacteriota bacterium]MBI1982698.1 16S rRNA (cytidine(1402)-2'-O)-methyltransferase [Acidobacteriota bacterium]